MVAFTLVLVVLVKVAEVALVDVAFKVTLEEVVLAFF